MASAAALPSAPTTNVTFAVNYELPMVDQFMKVERKRRSSTNPTGATSNSNNIGSSNHGEENESSESEQQQQQQQLLQLQQQQQLPIGQRSPPERRVSARDKQKRSNPVTRTRVRYDLNGVPPVRRNEAFLECFETWWKKPPPAPTPTRRSTRLAIVEEDQHQEEPPPEFCQCDPGFPFLEDSSVLWTPSNRSEWEDTVSEMTAVCTQAALRRRAPADKSKPFVPPLSRDYIRDRIDIDDPLQGYQLRHKQGGWLQGFVLYTNFTTWTHGFHWDSQHPMSGFPTDGLPHPNMDVDGSLAKELEAEPRAGDPRGGGIVFSSLAEIGLLGGLGCGEYLLRMALQDIWNNPQYKYVVLQATDQSKAFYERFGFVRVGAICQYGKSEKAKAAEKKARGKGKSTKGAAAKGKGKGTAAAARGERRLASSQSMPIIDAIASEVALDDSKAVDPQSAQPPSANDAKLPPISEAAEQQPSALEESERQSQAVDAGISSSEVANSGRPTANGGEAISERPANDSKPASDETKSVTFEMEPVKEAQSADKPESPTGPQQAARPSNGEREKDELAFDEATQEQPVRAAEPSALPAETTQQTGDVEKREELTSDEGRSSSDEQKRQPSDPSYDPQRPADSEMGEKQTTDAPNEPSSSNQPDLQPSEPAIGAHGDVEMREKPTAGEPEKVPGRKAKPNVPEIDVANMPIVGYRHWTHANESEISLQKHGGPSYMMCLKLPERTANGSIDEHEACLRCGGKRVKADEVSFTDQMLAMLQVDRKPRIEQLGATSTPGGLKLARRSLSMPIEFNSSSHSLGINSGNASPRFGRKLIRRGSDLKGSIGPSVAPAAAKAKNSTTALSTTSSLNKNRIPKRSHSMAESEGPARKRQRVEIAVSSTKSAAKKAASKPAKSAAKKSTSKSRERTRTPKSETEVRPPPPKNGKPLSYAQKQYHSVWLAVPPDVPAAAAVSSPRRAHPLERAALAAVTVKPPPRERRPASSATTTTSAASKRRAGRPKAKIGRPAKRSSTAKSSRSSTSKSTKTTSRKSSKKKSSTTTTKLDDGREFYSVRGPDGKFIRVEAKGRGRKASPKTTTPRRSNSRSRSETVSTSSKRRVSEARKSNTSSSKKKKKSPPARSPPAKTSKSLFVLLKAGRTRAIDPKTFRKQKVQAFPKEKSHFYNKVVRRKRGSAEKYFYVLEYDEENKLLCLVPLIAKGTLSGQREGRPRYRCDIGETDANFKIVSTSDYSVVRSCAIMKTSLVAMEAWDVETEDDENFVTRSS